MPADEAHYKLMCLIQENPELSQRELARELGISVGKVNYCLRALTDKGFVKLRNFRNSDNKLRYAYKLTPVGLQEKAMAAARFLRRKLDEYEALKKEIDMLRRQTDA